MTVQFVLLRGAVALGLSFAGLCLGYVVGAPPTQAIAVAPARDVPNLVPARPAARVIAMQAPQSQRRPQRSTPLAPGMPAWNRGDLLR